MPSTIRPMTKSSTNCRPPSFRLTRVAIWSELLQERAGPSVIDLMKGSWGISSSEFREGISSMKLKNLFRKVQGMSADEVRHYLQVNPPDRFNLVDVRQPEEFEPVHLAGARLMPIKELEGRRGELDPDLSTIVY